MSDEQSRVNAHENVSKGVTSALETVWPIVNDIDSGVPKLRGPIAARAAKISGEADAADRNGEIDQDTSTDNGHHLDVFLSTLHASSGKRAAKFPDTVCAASENSVLLGNGTSSTVKS